MNFDPEEDAQFSFTIKGKPQLVWQFDEGKLRGILAGTSKRELATILVGFPSITRAEATFRPFWKRSFPKKEDDIVINSILEE